MSIGEVLDILTKFLNKVDLVRIRGEDLWELNSEFAVVLPDGRSVVVPKGFVTDKASVPLGLVVKRDDKYIIDGALVHDYLYATQKIEGDWISRSVADGVLLALCKHSGMGWLKRQFVRIGVRSAGWVFFNKTAKRLGNTK
jgi:hypothetical protein